MGARLAKRKQKS